MHDLTDFLNNLVRPSTGMPWPGYDYYNNHPPVVVAARPARGRPRHGSDHPRQTTYFTDANGMLVPDAVMGFGRSNSVSGGRPAQIVINNTQYDDFSPPHTSRSRRSSSYDDDSWDERAHSPRRHRDRSRDRSRRRSRDPSRNRSRDCSHEGRRHSHHHHGHQSRSPSPYPDLETERKMQKLAELERKEEEEAARERAEHERMIADARKAAEKKEQEEFKIKVLEEAEREKFEKQMKEKKKKDEEDRVFKARLKEMYLSQGYSEESIEIMIKDAEKKKKGHGSHSPHSPHAVAGHDGAMVHLTESTKIVSLDRPTWIKVHRKHLDPRTLDDYGLPWEWDDRDSNYIVIKRWISDKDQDTLFEHTRKLKEQRLAITNVTTIEMVKKEHGKLKLVREKSPARSRSRSRAFIFT
ncbi:MAG: hypothetical protein Q9181_000231 [Wetmoreana brouardii]